MNKLSSAVKYLSKNLPNMFGKASIEELVSKDKISYESASEAITLMSEKAMSTEATTAVKIDNEDKTNIATKALQQYFENTKFGAMVEAIKEDDTMLYTEYQNIENARARIMAEIVQKEEFNYNTLLNELKTVKNTNTELLDKLIQTKVSVDDIAL